MGIKYNDILSAPKQYVVDVQGYDAHCAEDSTIMSLEGSFIFARDGEATVQFCTTQQSEEPPERLLEMVSKFKTDWEGQGGLFQSYQRTLTPLFNRRTMLRKAVKDSLEWSRSAKGITSVRWTVHSVAFREVDQSDDANNTE